MSDIVERLQKRAAMVTPWATCCGEAAAEIKRLTAERNEGARWRRDGEAQLRAEIARLKRENQWLYDQIAAQKRTAGAAAVAALEPKP